MSTRRTLLAWAAAAALLVPAPALAFWTASSAGGGAGAATAGSVGAVDGLAAAATPTADADVRLTWDAATRADGGAVAGYRVRRYAGGVPADVCGSADGPLDALACSDDAVPDGTYVYGVAARVGGAWTGRESRVDVVVDTSAPSISAAPEAATAATSATFAFAHPRYARFACRLDGAATTPCDGGTATYADLAPGAHAFAVVALDAAGHATAAATASWTIAAPPDAPSAVALANGGGGGAYVNLANRADVSVAVTLPATSTASDTVAVVLSDGVHATAPQTAAATAGAGTVTVTGIDASALADGAVTISATATGASGAVSTARTATVAKDVAPPAPPVAALLAYDGAADSLAGAGGAVEAGATVRVDQTAPAAAAPFTGTADAEGAFAAIAVAAADGSPDAPVAVALSVVAVDAAGNASAPTAFTATDAG